MKGDMRDMRRENTKYLTPVVWDKGEDGGEKEEF